MKSENKAKAKIEYSDENSRKRAIQTVNYSSETFFMVDWASFQPQWKPSLM